MSRFLCFTVILAFCLCLALAQKHHDKKKLRHQKSHRAKNDVDECKSCKPEACLKPLDCYAGVVWDRCGCCKICAKQEYELCDHPKVTAKPGVHLGNCGEQLECRLREDLLEPEAICYCRADEAICGSDNTTYNNLCQLMAAIVRKKTMITAQSHGPCEGTPKIVSSPDHVKNKTGSNVALACEAKGFPIPTIEWTWTRVDGKTVFLPSDDYHTSVNVRGGPEKFEVTGWLQIMDLQKKHEGDYTCIAQNTNGVAQESARIKVTD